MYLDIGIALILLVFFIIGGVRGFLYEALSTLFLLIVVLLTKQAAPQMSDIMDLTSFVGGKLNNTAIYLITFILIYIIIGMFLTALGKILRKLLKGMLDTFLGAVIGLIKGIMLSFFILTAVNVAAPLNEEIENAVDGSYLNLYYLNTIPKIGELLPSSVNRELEIFNINRLINEKFKKN